MWLIIVTSVICACYLALIIVFHFGWRKVSHFEPTSPVSPDIFISVVVACHNEESNIGHLLSILSQQSFQQFELIIVNDHSTDKTKQIVEQAMHSFPQLHVIDSVGYGKKNALNEGVRQAKYDLIVTTDADCSPSFHWLESVVSYYNRKKPDLIISPVIINTGEDLFSRLQALEFCSLVASGAGAAGAGKPILCNGANLAFTKEVWLRSFDELKLEEQSGDDIFLLLSVKKNGGNICFLKSESAIVNTEPMPTLKAFFKQRKRWAAKSTSYTDWHILIATYLIFLICFIPFVIIGFAFVNPMYFWLFGALHVFKFLVDLVFLYSVQSFFQLEKVWYYSFVLSLVYPFYVVTVGLSSVLFKSKKWK